MSKMGNYILDLQEAATRMSLQEFIAHFGFSAAEVWHDINFNFGDDRDCDCELELAHVEMDDGA